MFYSPLIEIIAEYFKGLKAKGFTFCLWLIICSLLLGLGILEGSLRMVVVGFCLWVAGGFIYGVSFKSKEEVKDE